jgi:predicted deacylase
MFRSHTITGRQPGPHLLVTAGVHGDEFEPMVAARRLIDSAQPELASGRLTVVPIVNEAAYARGNRVAEDGVDLARTCPGRAEGAVTERTAYALAELIRTADYYIDLHTGGTTMCVWPLVGYMLHADPAVLEPQRQMARAFHLPLIWGTDASLEGRSLSVARDANIPAIYAEYLGGGHFSPSGVAAYVAGCLNVLRMLGMTAPREPQKTSRPAWIVEDPRAGSGHMQRCYPAPRAGIFVAAVPLGQQVEHGAMLGELLDPPSGESIAIVAETAGIVVVLRTFPRVATGDSLAVLVETDHPEVRTSREEPNSKSPQPLRAQHA